MAKISISMTDTMEAFVHERIKEGDYNNVSEYFRDLVRRDQENRDKYEVLKTAIQRGIDSGISPRTPQDIMADVKSRLMNDGRLQIKP
jgi:antitoxin ParD1/3/4